MPSESKIRVALWIAPTLSVAPIFIILFLASAALEMTQSKPGSCICFAVFSSSPPEKWLWHGDLWRPRRAAAVRPALGGGTQGDAVALQLALQVPGYSSRATTWQAPRSAKSVATEDTETDPVSEIASTVANGFHIATLDGRR
jgi:hypothetical protein